jgi:hypothetical protein
MSELQPAFRMVLIDGITLDSPHVFPIRIWEEAERVDPVDVAEALRAVWGRYSVREFLSSEHDWSSVLLELADEGLPVTRVPRSPSGWRRGGSSPSMRSSSVE